VIGARTTLIRGKAWIGTATWVFGLWAAWQLGRWISKGDMSALQFAAMGATVCVIGVVTLKNWRRGFYIFLVWLLLEDLVRKFMGNSMIVYFGKDVLVGLTFLSLVMMARARRLSFFRPPFMIWFSLFFLLAVMQVFNPNSPSLFYGLLGFKLYFYYFPLIFVGYALIRDQKDLYRFLLITMIFAGLIAGVGIVQAVVGPQFLNPAEIAPDIRQLSTLYRYAPISGAKVFRPSSVFVSDGRFASYLVLMWIVGLGMSGYLLLRRQRGQLLVLGSMGFIVVAIALSGSRGAFVESIGSTLILIAAFLWNAPLASRQAHRLGSAASRICIAAGCALLLGITFFPDAIGARWSLYSETLSPSSPYSELVSRGAEYPTENLMYAITQPNWIFGNGIGTTSLGTQYITRILREPPPTIGSESGWGNLLLELGILGLALWLAWTVAATVACWRVAICLMKTVYAPLGFSIAWFVFLLLILTSYHTLAGYQNYISNAYLWVLMGILFRLPGLAARDSLLAAPYA